MYVGSESNGLFSEQWSEEKVEWTHFHHNNFTMITNDWDFDWRDKKLVKRDSHVININKMGQFVKEFCKKNETK